jgi:hypothetical protein
MGLHAIWVPAGLLVVTLILFVIDEREHGALTLDCQNTARVLPAPVHSCGRAGDV